MGSCLSKKGKSPAVVPAVKSASLPAKEVVEVKAEVNVVKTEQRKAEDEDVVVVKKEISVTKHRKSHDKKPMKQEEEKQLIQIQHLPQESENRVDSLAIGTPVRTSSCTREEVDAILIQCGRLSRSSSANTPVGKKYSGSKRSFDFDNDGIMSKDEGEERQERRQSRSRSSPLKPGRRRTPSRERDSSVQRSGSRERSVAGSGRRVSRSPGRRSEAPLASGAAEGINGGGSRPGKLVSVPASVTSSLGAGNEQNTVKKLAVKRDARSPRSQSPAQIRQPQPQTLSRSGSRKTDQSPYRRNPLSELDNNHSSQQALRKASPNQRLEEGGNRSLNTKKAPGAAAKADSKMVVQPKGSSQASDSLQPRLNRSNSRSRSRDFDELNLGGNPNPNPSSYASILLEDIQTFHQKSSNTNSNVAFTLPQCVAKACSIMDAVADMNSATSCSVISKDDEKLSRRRKSEAGDPFVETELSVNDDLMEPSLHKYVTMRRGGDMGDDESSGSNSVAGGSQQQWGSPLEPTSVESTGGLTSKASKQRPFESSSRILIRS